MGAIASGYDYKKEAEKVRLERAGWRRIELTDEQAWKCDFCREYATHGRGFQLACDAHEARLYERVVSRQS
jgi:hypothetical protein